MIRANSKSLRGNSKISRKTNSKEMIRANSKKPEGKEQNFPEDN